MRRNTVIYDRVSTLKQKKDLENQVELLKKFCFQNGWQVHAVYQDTASGISFEKRKDFFEMLDEILSNCIDKVVVSYKDRLSRFGSVSSGLPGKWKAVKVNKHGGCATMNWINVANRKTGRNIARYRHKRHSRS